MNIAIFNGLKMHFEMFGYIIYFCKIHNYSLTIYHPNDGDLGFLKFYKNIFKDYFVQYKDYHLFDKEKNIYDTIFLTTDNDYEFNRNDMKINDKTICIEHYYQVRTPIFIKRIATRPFPQPHYRTWALPVYPIMNVNSKNNCIVDSDTINIVITGYTEFVFDVSIINRLRRNDGKKIVIYAISREMSIEQFTGIDASFTIKLYKNIDAEQLYDILYHSHYVLVDVSSKKDHTCYQMSGIIPMAISTLTPLIISRETNSYYRFENVVEYDKYSENRILLDDINMESLHKEREQMVCNNHNLFNRFIYT